MRTLFKIAIFIFLILTTLFVKGQKINQSSGNDQYDLIILSGTPAGIMAGIAAAKMGKKSLVLERYLHLGGLPANGLGATDIATRGATGGLFDEFVKRIEAFYINKYGKESQQFYDCKGGYHFEPSVAEQVLQQMLKENPLVKCLTSRQFDADPANLKVTDRRIQQIKVKNLVTGVEEFYQGKMFIDASYEGDLIAAARVSFRIGRESKDDFNEPYAGRVYKSWGGEQVSPSTNQGDNAVQAYNYRLCLTRDAFLKKNVTMPVDYNRNEYVSLIDDVLTGRNTSVEYLNNLKGTKTSREFKLEGIQRIVNTVTIPNKKVDANNQHLALISTDLPEENWPWATSGWEWRDKFAWRQKNYTLGLLYFSQNDPALPESFRSLSRQWGLAADEFKDNDNFPRQIYVREGRRMIGMYIFKATDAIPVSGGSRPPVYATSITSSHYDIDSHAVRKREADYLTLEGFLSYPTAPYTVPFGTIVPNEITNLLAPVPASATHLGFSTLRMEPCWMALGQAAGIAACRAIEEHTSVQKLSVIKLQNELIHQNAVLIYYKDVKIGDPYFKALQYFGIRGLIPEWEANLNVRITAKTLKKWQKITGMSSLEVQSFSATATRGEILQRLYQLNITKQ